MTRTILLAGLTGVTLLAGNTGCRHCCRRNEPLRERFPIGRDSVRPPRGGYLDDPVPPRGGLIPPPPGGLPADSGGFPPPPVVGTDNTRNSYRPEPPAASSGPKLLLPDPLPGDPRSAAPRKDTPPTDAYAGRRLDDPARVGGTSDLPPRPPAPALTASSPAAEPAGTVPGVADFVVIRDNLAAGRKPAVEGFDALAGRGYETIIYVHSPAADTSAVRDMLGKKNLKFIGVAASPETFAAAAARFNEAVGDKSARPAFAYDDAGGGRIGMLWYVYFRTTLGLGDDAARVRAAPLGLKDAAASAYWPAAQAYLATR